MQKVFLSVLMLSLMLITTNILAQDMLVKGRVLDANNGEGIIGATIIINKSSFGSTALNGHFSLQVDKLPCVLEVSYIGYRTQKIRVRSLSDSLLLHLRVDPFQLQEVVVKSRRRFTKDQYTWFLHNKIVENSDKNNPDNIRPLTYSDYDRTSVFRIKKNKKAKADTTLNKYLYMPFMITEKITHNSRRFDVASEEKAVIYSNSNVILKDMTAYVKGILEEKIVVDVNFYYPQTFILGKGFPSPLAKSASVYYRMYVTDSVKVNGRKQYKFQYFPKSKKSNSFKGNFIVDSATWAVTEIDAELPNSANLNFASNFKVKVSYQPNINKDRWFKKEQITQLNISILNDNNNTEAGKLISFKLKRINAYNLIDSSALLLSEVMTEHKRDSVIYSEREKTPLDTIELKANERINIMKGKTGTKLLNRAGQMFITSYLNLGYIDFGPYLNIYRNTLIEGHKFTLPLRTSEKLFKNFSIGGHLSYGLGNREFGYGAEMLYRVPKSKRFILSGEYCRDYFDLSHNRYMQFIQENPFSQGTGNFLSNITTIRPNPYMIKKSQISVGVEYEINPNVGVLVRPSYERFTANKRNLHYTPHVVFNKGGKSFDYFDAQTILLDFRFSKDQTYEENFFDRVYYGNEKPIYHISLLTGRYNLQGETKGGYFANLNFSIKWRVNAGPILFTSLLEVGGVLGDVPYPLLDLPRGSGDLGSARFHYNLLDHSSLVSDVYSKLHLTMNMGGIFFNLIPLVRRLNLREIIGFKVYYGALLGNHNSAMEIPSFLRSSPLRPYMEFSAGITNIFKVLRVEYVRGLDRRAIKEGYAFEHGVRIRCEISF